MLKTQRKILCKAPKVIQRPIATNISPIRARAIIARDGKWANGTPLKYYFYKDDDVVMPLYSDDQRRPTDVSGKASDLNAVRKAFKEWKSIGIGLDFIEVSTPQEAEIRVGFWSEDPNGNWSFLGRSEHLHSESKIPERPTMNFAQSLSGSGYDTALHEIGHAIGLVHAHKHPNCPLIWNEDKIYENFRALGWKDENIQYNIFERALSHEVFGSEWDPNSIMQYPFFNEEIDGPANFDSAGVQPAGGLSSIDKTWVKYFYPEQDSSDFRKLQIGASEFLNILPGEQANFIFEPSFSRTYQCQLIGDADCVVVIFEDIDDAVPEFRSGEDDSGDERNVNFSYRFLRGHRYHIKVILNYLSSDRKPAIIIH